MSAPIPPARCRRRLSARGFRWAACAAAGVLTLAMFFSAHRELEIGWVGKSQETWSVALRSGCVAAGHNDMILMDDLYVQGRRADRRSGLHVEVAPVQWLGVAMPWRPYRTSTPGVGAAPGYGVGIPMWQPTLVALLIAGYAHGVIVGERRATIGKCRRCGYDVARVPQGSPCPECGTPTAQGVTAA